MPKQPNDDKAAEALRWLLHYLAQALESRLADRMDRWMKRVRRGDDKPQAWKD